VVDLVDDPLAGVRLDRPDARAALELRDHHRAHRRREAVQRRRVDVRRRETVRAAQAPGLGRRVVDRVVEHDDDGHPLTGGGARAGERRNEQEREHAHEGERAARG
jgi:hypothetical protein